MNTNYHLIILAGGSGQRFWPWSTRKLPKQFHDFLGTGRSLLQTTVQRFQSLVPQGHIWILTQKKHILTVQKQLPELNPNQILCEPASRNTAACIAYACISLHKNYPNAQLIIVPSDHIIQHEELLCSSIQKGLAWIEKSEQLLLLGTPCKGPEIGYGYIGYKKDEKKIVNLVTHFIEKPTQEAAQNYISKGNYVWNMGIFIGNLSSFIKYFKQHTPTLWHTLDQAYNTYQNNPQKGKKLLHKSYKDLPSIPFDEAIITKLTNCYVIILEEVGWLDLGNFSALYSLLPKDGDGNVCQGQIVSLQTKHCFIKSNAKQLIVTYGIEKLVIIQQGDSLLICSQEKIKELKKALENVEKKSFDAYL